MARLLWGEILDQMSMLKTNVIIEPKSHVCHKNATIGEKAEINYTKDLFFGGNKNSTTIKNR